MKRKAKEEKVSGENYKKINKEDWIKRKGKVDKKRRKRKIKKK